MNKPHPLLFITGILGLYIIVLVSSCAQNYARAGGTVDILSPRNDIQVEGDASAPIIAINGDRNQVSTQQPQEAPSRSAAWGGALFFTAVLIYIIILITWRMHRWRRMPINQRKQMQL